MCIIIEKTNILTIKQRISAFAELAEYFDSQKMNEEFIQRTNRLNPWFTPENTVLRFDSLIRELKASSLEEKMRGFSHNDLPKSVALVAEDGYPLAHFESALAVLLSGFQLKIRVLGNDAKLTRLWVDKLCEIDKNFASKVEIVERLVDFDLVLVQAPQRKPDSFERYFSKYPHLIEKPSYSIAVLEGKEKEEDFVRLGRRIFDYFGRTPQSVSKLYVPKGYDFTSFFKVIEEWAYLSDHFKFRSNYDYKKSVFLLNREKHLDNGFVLLREKKGVGNHLPDLFYEEYEDRTLLEEKLAGISEIDRIYRYGEGEEITEDRSFGPSELSVFRFLKENREE